MDKNDIIKMFENETGDKYFATGWSVFDDWACEKIIQSQKTKWVSAKDKLPKINVPVLGYCPQNNVVETAYNPDGELFFNHIGGIYEITHWKPLPDRPTLDKT